MKHGLRKLLAVMSLAVALVGTAGAQTRIGTVDLQKIFDGYWRRKEADAALREHGTELEKESLALREEYKKSAEAYKKLVEDSNDQAVSAEERAKRKKMAEGKLKDLKDSEETIRQYEAQARTRIEEQRRRMRDKILEEIRAAINAQAKKTGYTLVVDISAKSGNSTVELISMALSRQDPIEELAKTTPVVLYSSGENDLTTTVLEQLNASERPGAVKPPEKSDKAEKPEKKPEKK